MRFDAGNASDHAHASVRAKAKKKLDIDRVEAELPPLASLEDVKTRLDKITRWAAAGIMPANVASACVRACEVYLKAHDAAVTQAQMREAERTIKALKVALADAQKAGGLRRDAHVV
jgi:hypothetical protein